jgi:hypothetical protein
VDDNDWKQLRCPLSSITKTASGGSSLNVNPTCFDNNNSDVPDVGFPFNGAGLPVLNAITWIENAYQLLTQPGQFYLDSAAGYLYYIPRPGQNMATADAELPVLTDLVDLAGTPGHLTVTNDTDPGITYTGSWSHQGGRTYGDFDNDVHVTTVNGDSASYTFTGTGIEVLTETNDDEGNVGVYIDGSLDETSGSPSRPSSPSAACPRAPTPSSWSKNPARTCCWTPSWSSQQPSSRCTTSPSPA